MDLKFRATATAKRFAAALLATLVLLSFASCNRGRGADGTNVTETTPEPTETADTAQSTEQTPTDEPTSTESEPYESESTTDAKTEATQSADVTTGSAPEPPEPTLGIVDLDDTKYTYDDMVADLEALKAAYGDIFSYSSIAVTADGRQVYAAVVGNGNAKQRIVADAGTHGREWINSQAMMGFVEELLSGYDTGTYGDKKISDMLSETEFCFIPMLNPDGITISQLGIEGLLTAEAKERVQRIYREQYGTHTLMSLGEYLLYWKANSNGVDINRNFPVEGKAQTENIPTSPSNSGYSPYPCSENETKGYVDYINSLDGIKYVISVHSAGEVIYWNCGQKDGSDSRALAQKIGGVTGYTVINYSSFTAASSDWTEIEKGIASVTVETGLGTCPLAHSQLSQIYSEIREMFLSVVAAA